MIKCPLSFGGAELLRLAHHSIKHLRQAPLLVNQQSRIANNDDEENVLDLQIDLFFDLSGHEMREGGNVRTLSVCEWNGETDKRAAVWNPLASFSQAV